MNRNDTRKPFIAAVLAAGTLAVFVAGCSSPPPPAVPPPPVQNVPPPTASVPAPPPSALNADQMNRVCQAAPDTCQRVQMDQPLTLEDVKTLTRVGINADTIIEQVKLSQTVFHLTAAQIIDLKQANVTDQVLNFMLSTPSAIAVSAPVPVPEPQTDPYSAQSSPPPGQTPPPPLQVETPPPTPGPDYVWVGGDWVWNGGWVWVGGRWAIPPYRGAVWYHGGWRRGWGGYRYDRRRWR